MVTRLKKLLACLIAFTLFSPAAMGATTSPTAKPTAKVSAKPTPTPVAKTTSSATATKKAVVKKKVVKRKPRKKISLSPSPRPNWPLFGFKSDDGEIWAKIPTAKELIGNASNNKNLTRELGRLVDGVPVCEKYSCGAVQVASENGCTWWDITANVSDSTKAIFGTIRRTVGTSEPRQMVTVLLASQEDIAKEHIVTGINITCHHDTPDTKVPFTQYFPVEK
jgi:hypothetical protein